MENDWQSDQAIAKPIAEINNNKNHHKQFQLGETSNAILAQHITRYPNEIHKLRFH